MKRLSKRHLQGQQQPKTPQPFFTPDNNRRQKVAEKPFFQKQSKTEDGEESIRTIRKTEQEEQKDTVRTKESDDEKKENTTVMRQAAGSEEKEQQSKQ